MVWKVISVLVVFILVVFSFAFMLGNSPRDPVELKMNYLEPESLDIIEYGATPVFAENLRFTHNLISYSIGENCGETRRNNMISAFNIFSDSVKLVSFYETSESGSDIDVKCSDKFVELAEGLFTAGEGGPSRIINTSGFKVIEVGDVVLYKSEDCGYPIVALHELGHVFGFSHSEDPSNIMYNVSRCDQRMSEDMIDTIQALYSIDPLADVRIDNANAVAKGKYLDFNVSVLNEGLRDVDDVDLTISIDGEEVETIKIGKIEIGYGRTLKVENMRISRLSEKVEFILDVDNSLPELNEGNNVVELVV